MLAVSIPKAATASALVETATKCFAIAPSSPKARSTQSRAEPALAIVSWVVKVFEETIKSVSAGSRSRTASAKSVPSTLDTNRSVRLRSLLCRSAWQAITGPRSEPPMPMLTTARIGLPVWPVHRPARTSVAYAAIASSTACTPGTTSSPSKTICCDLGARRATCKTARRSVTLIRSPQNIASARSATPQLRASFTSSCSVSPVSRCLEKSR